MSNAVLRSACYATGFGLVAVLGCKAYRLEFPAELTNRETALRVRYLGITGGVAIGVLVIFGAMFSYIPLFNAIFGVACSGAFVLSACLLFRSSYSSLLLLLVGVFLMAFVVGMALNAQVFYAAPTDPNQID